MSGVLLLVLFSLFTIVVQAKAGDACGMTISMTAGAGPMLFANPKESSVSKVCFVVDNLRHPFGASTTSDSVDAQDFQFGFLEFKLNTSSANVYVLISSKPLSSSANTVTATVKHYDVMSSSSSIYVPLSICSLRSLLTQQQTEHGETVTSSPFSLVVALDLVSTFRFD
jgi:hypothetical protein